ncbi:Zinc metalloproteinase nas-13 [Orchesella cincta]|uniref:Metalloendopeptidase n=1 Tax=Orchesella cincta TaxID=48709 RepID=A0A1D2NB86_ORCCI|nr:Zinc metalloproteinase nas-13 [Orchesella cincta]
MNILSGCVIIAFLGEFHNSRSSEILLEDDCFINYVGEDKENFDILPSHQFLYPSNDKLKTWTVYNLQKSGYGTSDHTLFIVLLGAANGPDILEGFSEGFPSESLEIIPAFHAPLAFMREQGISLYCYKCPSTMGKFHSLLGNYSISEIRKSSNFWNTNKGYSSNVVVHVSENPEWEMADLTDPNCVVSSAMFYKTMEKCSYAEMLVLRMLTTSLNVTFGDFRPFSDEDDEEKQLDWHLNIKWNEAMRMSIRNMYAFTRGSHHVVRQSRIKLIYCSPRSEMENMTWNIYFSVFDLPTWMCLLLLMTTFCLRYRSVLHGLDLMWPFFGMHFWLKHPRSHLICYVIPVVFIYCIYDSVMSTDFIHLETPSSIPDLFSEGYKLWAENLGMTKGMFMQLKHSFKNRINEMTGGRSFEEIFYNWEDTPSSQSLLPTAPAAMVKEMALKKIMLSTGLMHVNPLTQLFSYVDRAIHVGEDELCGSLSLPEDFHFQDWNSFRIWGRLKTPAEMMFRKWLEMGFVNKFQKLLHFKKALVQPVRWSEALHSVTDESAFRMNSPLGIACLCQLIGSAAIFFVYLFYLGWGNRRKIEIRLRQILLRSRKAVNLFRPPLAILVTMLNLSILSKFLIILLIQSARCQNPEEGGEYFEGDISGSLPPISTRSGIVNLRYRWPQRTVPYDFEPSYPQDLRTMFNAATAHISSLTCIRFTPRTTEKDYVYVSSGNGCYSNVGKVGGKQIVSLPRACRNLGTFVHELIHALGFHHEQSRTDRDQFVKIKWENIERGKQNNFDKYAASVISPFGVTYDYSSVMHYSRLAFSKNRRDPTIEAISAAATAEIGQRRGMSSGDVSKIKQMYCQ